jgi:hypothetical protein
VGGAMEPCRVRLIADGRTIADRVEGGIGHRPDATLPWSGYLVVPREVLNEVEGANRLGVWQRFATRWAIAFTIPSQ